MRESPPQTCNWPGCDTEVKPQYWLCREHWFILPKPYRMDIWRWTRKGQGVIKDPSREYIAAIRRAREWIYEHENIDDLIDAWHRNPGGKELFEFLGMTIDEYASWIRCPGSAGTNIGE